MLSKRRPDLSSGLLYSLNDTSPEAKSWWSRSDVTDALALLEHAPQFSHGNRVVSLHTGGVSLDDLAFAFEIGLGPVKHPAKIPAGIGVTWYGVNTEQSVTDLATVHGLLWKIKPRLLIEIGTMCGSSAVVLAKMMRDYDASARVVTFDKTSPEQRGAKCTLPTSGYGSPHWSALKASGNLVSIIGDATSNESLTMLRREAKESGGPVFVIDDASHVASLTVSLFNALSPLVSVGSYYLVQDTRLDYDCALSFLTMKPGSVYWYCRRIQAEGGPARAVATIKRQRDFLRSWKQDRSVEQWVITQHPGGYLKRVRGRGRL